MSTLKVNSIQNATGTTAVTLDASGNATFAGTVVSNSSMGMRNRIINGDMRIDQRNAGASVTQTAANIYSLDRWVSYGSQASKMTLQQSSTAAVGFTKSIVITSSSAYSITSSDLFILRQHIEGHNIADLGWGTANAKTVTLSFWVRSSLTGTFGGAIQNGSVNRSYPFTYTISAASTWEQKTVTIAGDTSGTWATDTTTGIRVVFGLGVGSTFSGTAGAWAGAELYSATGATSVVGTNGATFYITGVQLEVGSTATPFERRMYGQELALCQRYFWTNPNTYRYTKMRESDRLRGCTICLPVPMRATPTMTKISDPSGITWTWQLASVTSVYGDGTAPSDGYTDYCGVMQASAEL